MHRLSIRRNGLVGAAVLVASLALASGANASILAQVAGSPFATGEYEKWLAFSPSGGFVATSESGSSTVGMFSVNSTSGAVTPVTGSPFPNGTGFAGGPPYEDAFSPNGSLLASVDPLNGYNLITMFTVNASTGALTPVGSPVSPGAGTNPGSVAFSPDGAVLVTANSGGHDLSEYTVSSGGVLTALATVPVGSTNHPTAVAFNAAGTLLAVADANDNVSVFSVDPITHALTEVSGSPFTIGSNLATRGLAFSPSGSWLAVMNNATDISNTVYLLSVSASGALAAGPNSPFMPAGQERLESIAFSPDGTLLAGADFLGAAVDLLTVNSSTGALANAPGSPFSTGGGMFGSNEPNAVAFSPSGGLLATVNNTNTISVFSVTEGSSAQATLSVAKAGSGSGTVNSSPSGIACGASCSAAFNDGTQVTLNASPATGSTFAGWSGGGCSGSATCTVTVNANTAVTATFSAGGGTPGGAPPVNTAAPTITGTPTPGNTLSCSQGSWTNAPTGFTYQWKRTGKPIAGATQSKYVVQILDEAQTLSCEVTASNARGAGSATSSTGVLVAIKGTLACPLPSGSLHGSTLGPLSLGLTRTHARQVLRRFAVEGKNIDDFCLYGGWGIRVGYPSAKLLRSLSAKAGARVSGRIVLALTANPYYSLDGVQPGTPLATAARKLAVGRVFKVGGSEWYIASGAAANGILKVRHGVIQEIGIADRSITHGRKAQLTFLTGFRSS